jgi:Ca2+-transporting ATPase
MLGETAAAAGAWHNLADIRPIHTAVAGRARLHVAGLRGGHMLKRQLERGLGGEPGMLHVSASIITGNLLIRFDDALPVPRVVERIGAVLRGEVGDASGDAPQAETRAWHCRPIPVVAAELGTSALGGLSEADARFRLASHGGNTIPVVPARSGLAMFVEQFQNLPVALLAVAAGVSILTGGGVLEAAAILTVVGLNGVIGYATESRSERTIRSLAQIGQPIAHVIRAGEPKEIPLTHVVPGDLLVLQRGMVVPADGRVVAARDLTISEAVLTGESFPVGKAPEALEEPGRVPLGDRVNMVFRGTVVTGGSGLAITVATGAHTEVGHIHRMVGATETPETPMQRQLGELGRQLVWVSVTVCGAVFGVGLLRGFGVVQMFRSAVSLAVAAIPEGLPAVATTTLALGIEDMRRRDVLIRHLEAVETLAAVQVICFDKTGTLTLNEMSVARIGCGDHEFHAAEGRLLDDAGSRIESAADDPRLARLLEVAVLCSETLLETDPHGRLTLNGTATESALVRLALELGMDVEDLRARRPRLAIWLRTETYRFMVTTHGLAGRDEATRGRVLVAVKGSPAELLDRCAWELERDGTPRALTPERRSAIEQSNAAMAEDALRVLGFAFKEIDENGESDADGQRLATDLIWVGLAGLADPVRPGMRDLMATFHRAGIHTVMVTGDQAATGRTVARQLGLSANGEVEIVDAADLERLPPDELAAAARRAHVFARVSPAQKLQIVRALQRAGAVVAMTGDGVNDSPALKAADIGVALGRGGTEAAREVADLVLHTDDVAALAVAVERGRATYTNIRKAIHYLLSTNLSEIEVVLGAIALGAGEMLSPMQLLWINLVSDVFPGLGLACEPPEPGAMERGPRPAGEAIVRSEHLPRLAGEGTIITAGSLGACLWGVIRYGPGAAEASTMTFASLVVAQLLHALTCRSTTRQGFFESGEALPPNPALTSALALSFGAQLAGLVIPGLRRLLGIVPIGPIDIAVTLAGGVLPYFANEALASVRRKESATRATAAE